MKKGKLSFTGYKRNSKDKNNAFNVIPSNNITMKNVPHPVFGIDNFGNRKMMYPGEDYTFPGDYVTEYPMFQNGGVPSNQQPGFTLRPNQYGTQNYFDQGIQEQGQVDVPQLQMDRNGNYYYNNQPSQNISLNNNTNWFESAKHAQQINKNTRDNNRDFQRVKLNSFVYRHPDQKVSFKKGGVTFPFNPYMQFGGPSSIEPNMVSEDQDPMYDYLMAKQQYEDEQNRVDQARQNLLTNAEQKDINNTSTRLNLGNMPGAYYCNTHTCELMQDSGYTIPQTFTQRDKTYNAGNKIPVIPGNKQMEGLLPNLGFVPITQEDWQPGDFVQEKTKRSADFQGNVIGDGTAQWTPSHSMIYAGTDKNGKPIFYNAPGGDRNEYDKTPIYGDAGRYQTAGYRYQGNLPQFEAQMNTFKAQADKMPIASLPQASINKIQTSSNTTNPNSSELFKSYYAIQRSNIQNSDLNKRKKLKALNEVDLAEQQALSKHSNSENNTVINAPQYQNGGIMKNKMKKGGAPCFNCGGAANMKQMQQGGTASKGASKVGNSLAKRTTPTSLPNKHVSTPKTQALGNIAYQDNTKRYPDGTPVPYLDTEQGPFGFDNASVINTYKDFDYVVANQRPETHMYINPKDSSFNYKINPWLGTSGHDMIDWENQIARGSLKKGEFNLLNQYPDIISQMASNLSQNSKTKRAIAGLLRGPYPGWKSAFPNNPWYTPGYGYTGPNGRPIKQEGGVSTTPPNPYTITGGVIPDGIPTSPFYSTPEDYISMADYVGVSDNAPPTINQLKAIQQMYPIHQVPGKRSTTYMSFVPGPNQATNMSNWTTEQSQIWNKNHPRSSFALGGSSNNRKQELLQMFRNMSKKQYGGDSKAPQNSNQDSIVEQQKDLMKNYLSQNAMMAMANEEAQQATDAYMQGEQMAMEGFHVMPDGSIMPNNVMQYGGAPDYGFNPNLNNQSGYRQSMQNWKQKNQQDNSNFFNASLGLGMNIWDAQDKMRMQQQYGNFQNSLANPNTNSSSGLEESPNYDNMIQVPDNYENISGGWMKFGGNLFNKKGRLPKHQDRGVVVSGGWNNNNPSLEYPAGWFSNSDNPTGEDYSLTGANSVNNPNSSSYVASAYTDPDYYTKAEANWNAQWDANKAMEADAAANSQRAQDLYNTTGLTDSRGNTYRASDMEWRNEPYNPNEPNGSTNGEYYDNAQRNWNQEWDAAHGTTKKSSSSNNNNGLGTGYSNNNNAVAKGYADECESLFNTPEEVAACVAEKMGTPVVAAANNSTTTNTDGTTPRGNVQGNVNPTKTTTQSNLNNQNQLAYISGQQYGNNLFPMNSNPYTKFRGRGAMFNPGPPGIYYNPNQTYLDKYKTNSGLFGNKTVMKFSHGNQPTGGLQNQLFGNNNFNNIQNTNTSIDNSRNINSFIESNMDPALLYKAQTNAFTSPEEQQAYDTEVERLTGQYQNSTVGRSQSPITPMTRPNLKGLFSNFKINQQERQGRRNSNKQLPFDSATYPNMLNRPMQNGGTPTSTAMDLMSNSYNDDVSDYWNQGTSKAVWKQKLGLDRQNIVDWGLAGANAIASQFEGIDARRNEAIMKQRMNADALFIPNQFDDMSRGDYDINTGMIRPDRYNKTQFQGMAKQGGQYGQDQELYLSDEEIAEIEAMGGTIEYLD